MRCISISISFILHSRYINVAAFLLLYCIKIMPGLFANLFYLLLILNLLCKFIDNS